MRSYVSSDAVKPKEWESNKKEEDLKKKQIKKNHIKIIIEFFFLIGCSWNRDHNLLNWLLKIKIIWILIQIKNSMNIKYYAKNLKLTRKI
jgi:hypothetical protein